MDDGQRNPDNIWKEEVSRRLRALEGGARTGLSKIVIAEVPGPDTGPALLADGIYGNLSSPGPVVTVDTGERAVVIGSAILSLGSGAVYKNLAAYISYVVSGATTISPAGQPNTSEGKLVSDGGISIATITFVDVVTLTRGQNVFTMKFAYSSGAGGAASTPFQNMTLMVIPL